MAAKHLNLATIVDKGKVDSSKSFLILFEVAVKDSVGSLVDTLRFAKNSANVTFGGNTYTAANFDINIDIQADREPSVSITAEDETRTLLSYLDIYDGLVNSDVTMLIVHEDSLSGNAELEETFVVVGCSVKGYVVSIELGVESAVSKRFPNFRQFKDRCMWKYKGARCKYAGGLATCDYTRNGANGCVAHGNEINFGAFPGLNDLQ